VLEHLVHALFGQPLVAREEVHLGALEIDGRVRCELERVVDDLHLGPVVAERGDAALEVAHADVAPGARDVGPDVDLDGFTHD
jgi:hypothetical protein